MGFLPSPDPRASHAACTSRPVRPAQDRKGGNFLGAYPASIKPKHRPVDLAEHAELVARLQGVAPEDR